MLQTVRLCIDSIKRRESFQDSYGHLIANPFAWLYRAKVSLSGISGHRDFDIEFKSKSPRVTRPGLAGRRRAVCWRAVWKRKSISFVLILRRKWPAFEVTTVRCSASPFPR